MSTPQLLGHVIREKRKEKGIGLRAAARDLEISPSYLSKIELGHVTTDPSAELLHKFADYFEIPLSKIEKLTPSRADELMATDRQMSPALQALYRMAKDQPVRVQLQMLEGAVNAIETDPNKKQELINQLRRMMERAQGKDLARFGGPEDLFGFDRPPRKLSAQHLENRAEQILIDWYGQYPDVEDLPIDIEDMIEFASESDGLDLIVDDSIDRGLPSGSGPAILGVSRWSADGKRKELVVHGELFDGDTPQERYRCRFTLAHEYFHCIEHLPHLGQANSPHLNRPNIFTAEYSTETKKRWYEKESKARRLQSPSDWREWQANYFAACLLMPRKLISNLFKRMTNEDFVITESCEQKIIADQIARQPIQVDGTLHCQLADFLEVNPQPLAIRMIKLGLVRTE